jgi:hypothetical protein
MEAFKAFGSDIASRVATPPDATPAAIVGSYHPPGSNALR